MNEKTSLEAAEAIKADIRSRNYLAMGLNLSGSNNLPSIFSTIIDEVCKIIDEHTEQPVPQYHEGDYIIDGSGRLCRLGTYGDVDDPVGIRFTNTLDMRTGDYLEKPVCDIVRLADDSDWIIETDGVKWGAERETSEDGYHAINIHYEYNNGVKDIFTYDDIPGEQLCKALNIPIKPAKEK